MTRIITRKGNAYVPLSLREVALFYCDDRITFAIDFNGNKYRTDYNLKYLKSILDASIYFLLSKSVILHIDAISEFSNVSSGKLAVGLKSSNMLKEKIIISQGQAASFKQWLTGERREVSRKGAKKANTQRKISLPDVILSGQYNPDE